MKLRFFTIPMRDGEEASRELNQFLATQRILTVERQFVADGPSSAWAVCVSYVDRGARPAPEQGRRVVEQGRRVDYREVLSDADFAIFAELRSLRKSIAEKEGLPAYALFTNEQLAAMVQQRVTSLGALEQIQGVGASRVKKYGAPFLEVLMAANVAQPTANSDGRSPS